jgi:hypothetical protein
VGPETEIYSLYSEQQRVSNVFSLSWTTLWHTKLQRGRQPGFGMTVCLEADEAPEQATNGDLSADAPESLQINCRCGHK